METRTSFASAWPATRAPRCLPIPKSVTASRIAHAQRIFRGSSGPARQRWRRIRPQLCPLRVRDRCSGTFTSRCSSGGAGGVRGPDPTFRLMGRSQMTPTKVGTCGLRSTSSPSHMFRRRALSSSGRDGFLRRFLNWLTRACSAPVTLRQAGWADPAWRVLGRIPPIPRGAGRVFIDPAQS